MDGEKEKMKSLGDKNDSYSSIGDKIVFDPEKIVERLYSTNERIGSDKSIGSRESTYPEDEMDRINAFKNEKKDTMDYSKGILKKQKEIKKEVIKEPTKEEMKKAEKYAKMLRERR